MLSRVYAHHLLVVDDEDFHSLQQVFNLQQQRAIATALNTLVFKTLAPERSTAGIIGRPLSLPCLHALYFTIQAVRTSGLQTYTAWLLYLLGQKFKQQDSK